MQISHWLPVSSTVSRIRFRNCDSVARMIARADSSDVTTNVRSLNVSRLKTERSSSRAVNEKTRFAIANLAFSFTARDELRSVFSLDTFGDRRFLITSLLSVAAIVFATELAFFHRILDTVELTGNQWLICIGAGAVIVVASEIRKLLLRRAVPA